MTHSFQEIQSHNALVCQQEHRADCGAATIWYVLLSDGYLIDCGSQGRARANILADIINKSGSEQLSRDSLSAWTL